MSADAEAAAENRYEVRECIGKGAFGEVNLVVEKQSKQRYVLKRIKMARQSEWQRRATRQEIEIVSRLRHPFIMPYKEHWIHHGHTINVVYGYCEKGDLSSAITKQKGKPFPEETLRLWLAELLLGVEYMHRQNVLHRDIKTPNILLTIEGDVQLGDFGLATVRVHGCDAAQQDVNLVGDDSDTRPDASGHDTSSHGGVAGTPERPHHAHMHANAHLPHVAMDAHNHAADKDQAGAQTPIHDPKTGTRNDYALVGTPHFMSPELLSSQKYSYETDIWSLGVVMYELTTLKPPFNAFNLAGLVAKIKRAALPPIPTAYSADWATVLKSMLRKDPTRRAGALDILAMPSMQQALHQARQRAQVMAPDTFIPDIPCVPSSAPASGGGSDGGFCFDVAAAGAGLQRTPSAGGGIVTPVLVCPDETAVVLRAEGSAEVESSSSPPPRFPDLESETSGQGLSARTSNNVTPRRSHTSTAGAAAAGGAPAPHEAGRARTPAAIRRAAAAPPQPAPAATPPPAARRHPTPQAAGAGAAARSRTPMRAAEEATTPTLGRQVRKASVPKTRGTATPSVPATPREEGQATGAAAHPSPAVPERPVSRLRMESLTRGNGGNSAPSSRHPSSRAVSSRRGTNDAGAHPAHATAVAAAAAVPPIAVAPIAVPSPVTTPTGDTDAEAVTPDTHRGRVASAPATATSTTPTSGPHHKLPPGGAATTTAGRTRDPSASAWRATRANSFTSARPTRAGSAAGAASPGGAGGVTAASPTAGMPRRASLASATTAEPPGGSILNNTAPARTRGASPPRSSTTPVTRRRSQPGNVSATGRETARESSDGGANRPTPERRVRRASAVTYGKPTGIMEAPQRRPSGAGPPPPHSAVAAAVTAGKEAAAAPAPAPAAAVAAAAPVAPVKGADVSCQRTPEPSSGAGHVSSAGTFAGGCSSNSMPTAPASAQPSATIPGLTPAAASAVSSLGGAAAAAAAEHAGNAEHAAVQHSGPSASGPSATSWGAPALPVGSHAWRTEPSRSRSLLSVTTEDSELSIPDGRYFTPDVSHGGGITDNGEATSGLSPAAGAASQPLWNSNQLFSGNYGSFGGAMNDPSASATAAAALGAAAAVGGGSNRSSDLIASAGTSGTLTGDLPRRVSISVFAPSVFGNDAATAAVAEGDGGVVSVPIGSGPEASSPVASLQPEHLTATAAAAFNAEDGVGTPDRGVDILGRADLHESASSSLSAGVELGDPSESPVTEAVSYATSASSPSMFGPSPGCSPNHTAAAGTANAGDGEAAAAAAGSTGAALRRRTSQDRTPSSPRHSSGRMASTPSQQHQQQQAHVPQLRPSRSLDARGSSAGSGVQGVSPRLSPRLSPRVSPRTGLLGEPSSGGGSLASTASAQRSFAGFVIHQPPSPSGWRLGAGGSPISAAESADSSADATSPLRPVAEAEELDEVQSAPPPADAAAAAGGNNRADRLRNHAVYGLSGTEREQLVLLQRVVGLASSLWEAGRDEELGAVLSSTLSRPLVRGGGAVSAAGPEVHGHAEAQATQRLEPGAAVRVVAGPLRGAQAVVRYRGPCHWGAGVVVGLELPSDAAEEHGDATAPAGVRDGVTYFRCKGSGHRAAFVPLEHVSLLDC